MEKHLDCIRKLLDFKANINVPTRHGSLPIHFAAYLGNTEVFDLFASQVKPSDLSETDQRGNVNKIDRFLISSTIFPSRHFFILLLLANLPMAISSHIYSPNSMHR